MALYYRTEYRIGNRGRICRSYTGLAAFGAIVFDLGFGLIFELVTAVIGLSLRLVCMALSRASSCCENRGARLSAVSRLFSRC